MTEKDGHEKSHVELARSLIELLPRSAGGLAATLILVLIVLAALVQLGLKAESVPAQIVVWLVVSVAVVTVIVVAIVSLRPSSLRSERSTTENLDKDVTRQRLESYASAQPRTIIGLDLGRDSIACGALNFPAKSFTENTQNLHSIALHGGQGVEVGSYVHKASGKGYEAISRAAQVIVDVAESISRLHPEALPVVGFGIAMPGLIDLDRKILKLACYGMPAGTDVVERIAQQIISYSGSRIEVLFGVPQNVGPSQFARRIFVDNDATSMARSFVIERRVLGNCACILLGQGVGAGLVAAGRLLHGDRLSAGEIGHQTLEMRKELGHYCPEATPSEKEFWTKWLDRRTAAICPCGRQGLHWEVLCNADALIEVADLAFPNIATALRDSLATAIVQPDNKATWRRELLKESVQLSNLDLDVFLDRAAMMLSVPLGIGIANLDNIIDVKTVVLFGEMTELLEDHLPSRLRPIINRFALQADDTNVLLAGSSSSWTWRGAAQIFVDSTYPADSQFPAAPRPRQVVWDLHDGLP
jgi:predicted NBD/HSP70 family sugar kinase